MMFFQSNKEEYLKLKNKIKNKCINKNIYLFKNLPTHYWIPFIKKFKKKIMLATSINEPLGRNIIEALLNNIFVVANNSGGHKEIINKGCGALCDTSNVDKAVKLINNLFLRKNNEIKKINLIPIKKKFQNKEFFRNIENIYLNI